MEIPCVNSASRMALSQYTSLPRALLPPEPALIHRVYSVKAPSEREGLSRTHSWSHSQNITLTQLSSRPLSVIHDGPEIRHEPFFNYFPIDSEQGQSVILQIIISSHIFQLYAILEIHPDNPLEVPYNLFQRFLGSSAKVAFDAHCRIIDHLDNHFSLFHCIPPPVCYFSRLLSRFYAAFSFYNER